MRKLLYISCIVLCWVACKEKATTATTDKAKKEASAEDSATFEAKAKEFTPENHVSTMEEILGKPKYDIRTIGILVYDGVNELDMMGPRYVLGQAMGVKTMLIAPEKKPITTVMGVTIVPDTALADIDQLDILVIPGGFKGTIEAAYDQALHDWIRKIDKNTVYTSAVCTGVWILGATGLLEDKKATTNWYNAAEMLKKYGATFTKERFTQDGKYWTSAGVTAGMDMSLAMMKDIWGEKYAQAVMLDMEYDPQPPIKGGSLEKTDTDVRWMMQTMYDAGVQPLIDSLEQGERLKD